MKNKHLKIEKNSNEKFFRLLLKAMLKQKIRERAMPVGRALSSFVLALLMLSSIFRAASFASFEDIGTGARTTGLGGAFTPLADDLHALYYNPAGLVYLRRKEVSATYGLLQTGLSDKSKMNSSYVIYGHPIDEKIGTVGVSYQQVSLEGLYGERTIAFGYGRRISQKLAMGTVLKHLYREFTAPAGQTSNDAIVDPTKSDPVFDFGSSRSNVGLDFGILYRPYRNYSYGLALQNVNEPNMAIADSDSDAIPMMIRTGIAYNERTLTLVGELDSKRSFSNSRDYVFTAGAEKWWLGAGFAQADLAVRGALAFGSRSFSQMTLGLSYRLSAVQIDYGMLMPLGGITFGSTQGNHRITLSLRFGRTVVEPDYEIRMRAAEISAKKAEEELEQARKESDKLEQELERIKTESEKRKEAVQATRQKSGMEAANKQSTARFLEVMDNYWRRKSAGASVDERIGLLSQIMKEFAGAGLDLSQVERELAIAKSDRAKSEVDLAVSWSYYQKIVARGASIPERIELLSRMIERFARTGVDLTIVREELNALRGKR